MVTLTEPWSAKHKRVTKHGSLPYNLSNSYAQPLSTKELIDLTLSSSTAVHDDDDSGRSGQHDDNSDSPRAPSRSGQDIVDEYYNHELCYTSNGGSLDLKEEIANVIYPGPDITEDHIVVFPGAQVGIQTAAFAIVGNHNDNNDIDNHHSIVFTPGYQSIQEAPIHASGGRGRGGSSSCITKIQLSAKNNWQINVNDIRNAIKPNRTKYIILNEPHNPTGTISSHETIMEIIQLAKMHDIYILCDEVYRLLEHHPPSTRLKPMCELYPEKGLSIVTLSKPYGACGISIGWIATQNSELKQRLLNVQYFNTACPSRSSELLAMMVLRSSTKILTKNMKIINNNIKLLDEFICKYNDLFSWVKPTAGAIAYIKFNGPEGISTEKLGNMLVKYGISIKPSYCFTGQYDDTGNDGNTNDDDTNKYFRIGYGEKNMPTALEKFIEFVDEHKESWRLEKEKEKEL